MICKQKRADCHFNIGGDCEILRNTDFNRNCPFFKKRVIEKPKECEFEGHNGRFRLVSGFDGRYFVSEYGEVVNRRGDVLRRKYDKYQHPVVNLKSPNETYTCARVAVLVANAFMQGYGKVEHIDGDPDNCELTNLRRLR